MKTNKRKKWKKRKLAKLWKAGLRRPKFLHIFARTLLPLLAAGILLCIVGTFIAQNFYYQTKRREFDVSVYSITQQLKNDYEEYIIAANPKETMTDTDETQKPQNVSADNAEQEDILKTRMAWRQQGFLEGECALYNIEDNTLYCSSEMAVFMTKRANASSDGKKHIYQCPQEAFGEVISIVKKYNNKAADNESIGFWFAPRDIYIAGGHFLPGKVDIISMGSPEYEILESYDLTPDDVTGYTHIETNYESAESDFLWPLLWDGRKEINQKNLQKFIEDKLLITDRAITDSIVGNFYVDDSIWNVTCYCSKRIHFDNGFEKQFFATAAYNILEDYGNFVYGSYGALFLLVLLLSLAIAYRRYIIRQAQYQMDTYRREMTNAMAHDLKSPLTAVYGFAENLKNNVHTEKREYYADVILKNVQYMNDLIEHILELAKTEEMTMAKASEVDLEQLIQEQLKKQEPIIDERNLQVSISGSCILSADAMQFSQIIDNLISNAVKYTRENGSISIQITQNGMEISNDMEEDLEVPADELWKPFVKGNNSRSGRQGTGIGLTIVKNLAEIQGFLLELQAEDNTFVARIK